MTCFRRVLHCPSMLLTTIPYTGFDQGGYSQIQAMNPFIKQFGGKCNAKGVCTLDSEHLSLLNGESSQSPAWPMDLPAEVEIRLSLPRALCWHPHGLDGIRSIRSKMDRLPHVSLGLDGSLDLHLVQDVWTDIGRPYHQLCLYCQSRLKRIWCVALLKRFLL